MKKHKIIFSLFTLTFLLMTTSILFGQTEFWKPVGKTDRLGDVIDGDLVQAEFNNKGEFVVLSKILAIKDTNGQWLKIGLTRDSFLNSLVDYPFNKFKIDKQNNIYCFGYLHSIDSFGVIARYNGSKWNILKPLNLKNAFIDEAYFEDSSDFIFGIRQWDSNSNLYHYKNNTVTQVDNLNSITSKREDVNKFIKTSTGDIYAAINYNCCLVKYCMYKNGVWANLEPPFYSYNLRDMVFHDNKLFVGITQGLIDFRYELWVYDGNSWQLSKSGIDMTNKGNIFDYPSDSSYFKVNKFIVDNNELYVIGDFKLKNDSLKNLVNFVHTKGNKLDKTEYTVLGEFINIFDNVWKPSILVNISESEKHYITIAPNSKKYNFNIQVQNAIERIEFTTNCQTLYRDGFFDEWKELNPNEKANVRSESYLEIKNNTNL